MLEYLSIPGAPPPRPPALRELTHDYNGVSLMPRIHLHRIVGPTVTFSALAAAYYIYDPLLRVLVLAGLGLIAAISAVFFQRDLRRAERRSLLGDARRYVRRRLSGQPKPAKAGSRSGQYPDAGAHPE